MWQVLLLLAAMSGCSHGAVEPSGGESGQKHTDWDDSVYLIICLCMGRFGNQVDHFLGALAFSKSIDRTLILPPWRTYKNVPFTDWFDLDTISQYHRVIVAEEFMEYLAPSHWPPDNRNGFRFSYDPNRNCEMKKGNPFGPFWDGLGVEFATTVTYDMSYTDPPAWSKRRMMWFMEGMATGAHPDQTAGHKTHKHHFSSHSHIYFTTCPSLPPVVSCASHRFHPDKYPVVALKGAPVAFPVKQEHRHLQKYLRWSAGISQQGDSYINNNFPGQRFIGVHLRNGPDWEKACQHAIGEPKFMASPQCTDPGSGRNITTYLCIPSTAEILRLTHEVVRKTGAKIIYVATDKHPLLQELTEHLKDEQVTVYNQDPWLPQIDLYILGQSDHFIGNCVSSFTSFVTRQRHVMGKQASFYGFS